MRTFGKVARVEFKFMAVQDRLAKVLALVEKGLYAEAIELGSKDFPLWDYLRNLSTDERDRFLFNNDRAYGGQLELSLR
jgi:hypothetical protein